MHNLHYVLKSDKKIVRPVLDIRFLNKKVIAPKVKVEQIKDILHRVAGSVCFSTFDCLEGHYGIPLHPESIECIAFEFQGRQHVWKFLPQGLKSSCAIFQSLMNHF